jgi:hypothetical protein
LLLALLALPHAHATELVWDGFYRGRGLLYDSLSLSKSNAFAEGTSNFLDHRLSLRPSWLLTEHAALHAQVDLLPYTLWGETTATGPDLQTAAETARASADGVATTNPSLAALRAWAEVSTKLGKNATGRFAAGRMPMEWGAGILWNPGTDPEAEAGDTADRLQFSGNIGPVWLFTAWDVQYEGLLGAPDDMQSFSLALGYRNETNGAALLNNYRYQPSLHWQAYTADLWAYAQLGPVRLEAEGVAVLGGGDDETGGNDLSQVAVGAMLNAELRLDPLVLNLEGGLATGDGDPDDDKLHTFTFDRDHNVALMLFEEPLPTLGALVPTDANGGRTTEAAISGDGISNALYLRPSVRYTLFPELVASLDWTTATLAKGPAAYDGRHGYGNEFDLSLRYDPFSHVWVKGTFGLFLPGAYYREYEHEDLGGGFDRAAIGGRLVGTVEF